MIISSNEVYQRRYQQTLNNVTKLILLSTLCTDTAMISFCTQLLGTWLVERELNIRLPVHTCQ